MENRRFVLLAMLGVVLFLMYRAWQEDYAPAIAPPPAPMVQQPSLDGRSDVPGSADLPSLGASPANLPTSEKTSAVISGQQLVTIETDKLIIDIDAQGGDIRRVELLGIPVSKDAPELNLNLLQNRFSS